MKKEVRFVMRAAGGVVSEGRAGDLLRGDVVEDGGSTDPAGGEVDGPALGLRVQVSSGVLKYTTA